MTRHFHVVVVISPFWVFTLGLRLCFLASGCVFWLLVVLSTTNILVVAACSSN